MPDAGQIGDWEPPVRQPGGRRGGSPLLFWHSAGASYKNFSSQFAAIVARTARWAAANGIEFQPFRFHDLRHWHAVHWLKSGRSIYELQAPAGLLFST